MKELKLDFDDFMEYLILKHKNVKINYPNLDIRESDLIKILMASYLDKFASKLSLEFYDHPITEAEIDNVIDKLRF